MSISLPVLPKSDGTADNKALYALKKSEPGKIAPEAQIAQINHRR